MEIEKHSPKWLLNEIRNAESDARALFKIIEFQKALTEQCNIADVVGQSEQLDKWIEDCQTQADDFFKKGMIISETSSLAMKVAYMNVKTLVENYRERSAGMVSYELNNKNYG